MYNEVDKDLRHKMMYMIEVQKLTDDFISLVDSIRFHIFSTQKKFIILKQMSVNQLITHMSITFNCLKRCNTKHNPSTLIPHNT